MVRERLGENGVGDGLIGFFRIGFMVGLDREYLGLWDWGWGGWVFEFFVMVVCVSFVVCD